MEQPKDQGFSLLPTPQGRFGRSDRLGLQREFRAVLRRGRRSQGAHFLLAAAPSVGSKPRLGLAIAKATGHAPDRARMRRLLREAFRAVRTLLTKAVDLVVLMRQPWPRATLRDVTEDLLDQCRRLRLLAMA